MRIEFRTFYDNIENEKMGQLYAKYCIDKQLKQLKSMRVAIIVICVFGFLSSIILEAKTNAFIPFTLFPLALIFSLAYIRWVKKKLYPKVFSDANEVGCPYNVTFGFYDEYFYEKFENNMSISEQSIRYEFLKKIIETHEYFILVSKRSQVYFLPKRDMGYEAVLELSGFFRTRLPYIYSFKG